MLTQDTVLQCPGPPPVVETHGRQSRARCVSGIPERYESADAGIEYQVANTVADEKSLVFEMQVRIAWMRAEGICRHVLMQFDAQAKVCLWQEVDWPKRAGIARWHPCRRRKIAPEKRATGA
ncbi:hypothetical protein V8Z74_10685 [Comamonas sp. w2-DMI]|uniref:hypothetical protein n=1 Tax=Comamonas sp. w2-DMI TaxID=3126391 RepID=UPI0032E4395C